MKGYNIMRRLKETKEISGIPADLEVGARATIYCSDGLVLWTSRVVDIRNKTNDGVEIETANSIYKLTYEDKFQLPFAV